MSRLVRVAPIVGLMWIATGCQSRSDPQRYIPRVETARQAIEAALTARQNGQATSPVSGTNPVVHLIDSSQSKPNQALATFEMLGEVAGDVPRCFAVQLRLRNPDAEVRERYVVIGIDPLWVFRHEDYELLMHWDHAMPKPEDEGARRQGVGRNDSASRADPSSEGK